MNNLRRRNMPDLPLKSILDREKPVIDLREHFTPQITLLKELANYGSNLVVRAFQSSDKGLGDAIICAVLLKQVVAMIDAVETLLSSACVNAAHLAARALFEASIYLEWILMSDAEEKAICYYVSNLRAQRTWAMRAIRGTSENQVFKEQTKDLDYDLHNSQPTLESEAKKHFDEVNKILSQPKLKEIDERFEEKKRKTKREPRWYSGHGVVSIKQIANNIGRSAEYNLFYPIASEVTHSASYKNHIRFTKNQIKFKPIRNLEGINILLRFVFSATLRTYRVVLENYRIGELPIFSKKYLEEWRSSFLSIKDVKYHF
jgi:hypothetical protein